MSCRRYERWILESLDRGLASGPAAALQEHLRACPSCRRLRAEHAALRDALTVPEPPGPRPGFASRVGARIAALGRTEPERLWRAWSLRAIPVSLFLIGLFVGGLLFLPTDGADLTQTEALMINGTVPPSETAAYYDETKKPEENTMQILFAATEAAAPRRPRP